MANLFITREQAIDIIEQIVAFVKSRNYDKDEVNAMISQIPKFAVEVVSVLPSENISTTTLYLVPSEDPTSTDMYDEWIFVESTSRWEHLGTQSLDLSDYYTKNEVNNLLLSKANKNDVYTKTQTDTLLDAKADISDIPTVPTTLSSFTDDLGSSPVHTHSQYITEHQSLSNYYTKTQTDTLLDAKADISDIPTALSAFTDDLGDNPVHTHSQYLTEHQSLSNYYTKTETDDLLDDKADASTTYSKTEVDDLLTSHDYTEGVNIDITSRVISLDIPIVEDDTNVPNGSYFAEFDENASNGEWASAQDVQALSNSVNSLTVTVNQKADLADVYTMAQVTDLLSSKADVDDIPTVPTNLSAFTDDLGSSPVHTHSQYLTEHQSLSGYYTKTQTDTLLSSKADASSVYTKTETDTLLNDKQDTLTFDNTPTESSTKPVTSGGVYTALSSKADSNSVYTITQTDETFTKKPLYIIPTYDSSTETYSITETNGTIKQALAEGRKVLLLTRYSTAVDSDGHYRYYPLNVEYYRYTPTATVGVLRAYYTEISLDVYAHTVTKTTYNLRVFNNDDTGVPELTVSTKVVTDRNTQEVYVIEASVNGSSDITFSDTFDNVHGFMENGYTVMLDDGSMMYTLQEYTNSYMLFVSTIYKEVYSIAWRKNSGGTYIHTALQPEIQVYNRSTIDESGISNSTVYMVLEDE